MEELTHPLTHSPTPREGLALTVEWDRDPGKGFKWFSPYWFANECDRDGVTYIVSEISSIGLVNNPNIPEFRLANSVDANGREHVEAGSPEGGQFVPKTDVATSSYGKDQINVKTADGKS